MWKLYFFLYFFLYYKYKERHIINSVKFFCLSEVYIKISIIHIDTHRPSKKNYLLYFDIRSPMGTILKITLHKKKTNIQIR